jgi:DNA repair protein RecO (recombination protein O)
METNKEISTNCIILRKTDYGETSAILTAISSDQGLISFIARGIRKPKSKYREELQLFSETNILIKKTNTNALHYFIDGQIQKNYIKDIDFESTIFIQAVSELFLQLLHPGEDLNLLYNLWKNFAEYIQGIKRNKILIFWRFCFRLFAELGIDIPMHECGFCNSVKNEYKGFSPIHHSFVCSCCFTQSLEEMSLRISPMLSFIIKNIYTIGSYIDSLDLKKSDIIKMNQIIKVHLQEHYHHKFHLNSLKLLY